VTYKHGLSFAIGAKIIPRHAPASQTDHETRGVVKGATICTAGCTRRHRNPFKGAKRDILIDLCGDQGRDADCSLEVRGGITSQNRCPDSTAQMKSNEVRRSRTIEVIARVERGSITARPLNAIVPLEASSHATTARHGCRLTLGSNVFLRSAIEWERDVRIWATGPCRSPA